MYHRYLETDAGAKARHDTAMKEAAASRYSKNQKGRAEMRKPKGK